MLTGSRILLPFVLAEHFGEAESRLICSVTVIVSDLGVEEKVLTVKVHEHHTAVRFIGKARMPNQTIECEDVACVHADFKVLATSTSKADTTSNDANEQRDGMIVAAIRMHKLMGPSHNAEHCPD